MKKIFSILIILLCIAGCTAKSTDPQMDEYFANWIADYQFSDNTTATLINKKKSNYTIMMAANADVALISMKNGDYTLDRYLCGNTEYFYVNTESISNKYFKVNVSEAAFKNPKDIYNQMVFDKNNVKNVVYVGQETIDGVDCDHVECKIEKNVVELYFNHVTGQLYKLEYVGGSSLVFDNAEILLPTQFDNAESIDVDTINSYIKEFQGK